MTVPTRRRWLPHRLGGRCGRVSRLERSAGQSMTRVSPRVSPRVGGRGFGTDRGRLGLRPRQRGGARASARRHGSARPARLGPGPRRARGRAAPPAQAGQAGRGGAAPASRQGPSGPTPGRPCRPSADQHPTWLYALSAGFGRQRHHRAAESDLEIPSTRSTPERAALPPQRQAARPSANRPLRPHPWAPPRILRGGDVPQAPGTTAPSVTSMPPVGQKRTCGSGSPKLFRNATPPDASAGNSFWRR